MPTAFHQHNMPCSSPDNLLDFYNYLHKAIDLIEASQTTTMIIGDFNADVTKVANVCIKHLFGSELNEFVVTIVCMQLMSLLNTQDTHYTCHSVAYNSFSWLDHMVWTAGMKNIMDSEVIEYQYIAP